MHYLGGKSRVREQVAGYLQAVRKGRVYIEPFCGACWITLEMSGVRFASDANVALINMYKSLQAGWIPPDYVSEEEYNKYSKIRDPNDPMTGFVGIACSFGGKWFGGYARCKEGRSYTLHGKRSLIKMLPFIQDVNFRACDYQDVIPRDALVYCDPPYAGTTNYEFRFDTSEFWDVIRNWSKNNTVLVSEFHAPFDFEAVLEVDSTTQLRDNKNKQLDTKEKLFRYKGC